LNKQKTHETQPEKEKLYNTEYYVDENLRSIQNIESGGPMRKIDLNSMPRPLRIFGYCFVTALVLMLIAICYVSIFR
jgi:hypothetical protein